MKVHSIRKTTFFKTTVVSSDTTYSAISILNGNGTIDFTRIGNRCVADFNLTAEIQSIILHKTYENNYEIMCYEPRNGILFYNSNHEMIGYMEICFECEHNYGLFIPKMELNTDQFKALKSTFLSEGLKVTY